MSVGLLLAAAQISGASALIRRPFCLGVGLVTEPHGVTSYALQAGPEDGASGLS